MQASFRALLRTRSIALAVVLPVVFGAGQALADTVIDFESAAPGSAISTQYQGLGVTFSSPGNPTQPEINTFSGNSTTGQVLADFSVIGGLEIDATFTAPITSVSVIAYANPSYVVTMNAYDAANNLLGSVSSAGGGYNQGTISLGGIGDISKVTWSTGSSVAAVGIDNLKFAPAVPEPQTWGMAAAGLLIAGGLARRRNARR